MKRHHHKIKREQPVQSKIKRYKSVAHVYFFKFSESNFKIFSSLETKQLKNDLSSRPNEQRLTTMTEEAEEYSESTTISPAQNMLQV